MRSRTWRVVHLATKVSAAATTALALAMFATMLPRASAGSPPADDPAPNKVKANVTTKDEPSKPAPAKVGLLLNDYLKNRNNKWIFNTLDIDIFREIFQTNLPRLWPQNIKMVARIIRAISDF